MAEHVGPVSFSVAAGEILALVGLRGAGHDIVGRVLFGDCKRTSGEIVLDGRRIEASAPAEAMRQHIGFVSSKRAEESLAGSMLVRENLFLNPVMIGTGVLGIIGRGAESADSAKLLKRFSVRPEDPERVVGTLGGCRRATTGARPARRRNRAESFRHRPSVTEPDRSARRPMWPGWAIPPPGSHGPPIMFRATAPPAPPPPRAPPPECRARRQDPEVRPDSATTGQARARGRARRAMPRANESWPVAG